VTLAARLAALERRIVPDDSKPIALWLDWRQDCVMIDGREVTRADGETSQQLASRAIETVRKGYAGRPLLVLSWQAP
jgi:hypothetical protein